MVESLPNHGTSPVFIAGLGLPHPLGGIETHTRIKEQDLNFKWPLLRLDFPLEGAF
jgi:hypothetical protein